MGAPDPDFTATQITLKDELYAFDMGDLAPGFYGTDALQYLQHSCCLYGTAYHACPMAHFKEMAESFDYGNNREEILMINGARVQLHLSKNPIGFQQKISLVLKDPKPRILSFRSMIPTKTEKMFPGFGMSISNILQTAMQLPSQRAEPANMTWGFVSNMRTSTVLQLMICAPVLKS